MKRKIRDLAIWFLMFCKRLLHRPSFIVLLLIIPISVTAVKLSVSDNSGVLKIGLCSEDSELSRTIVKDLLEKDSIVLFREYATEEEAKRAVLADEVQGAWIYPADLEKRIADNAKYKMFHPLVKVIEREDTVPLQLSHELLYGSLHPYITYDYYKYFLYDRYGDDQSEQEMRHHFENGWDVESIIEIRIVGEEQAAEINTNFLEYPLRGLLAILMVLCGLASMMFFLTDKRRGKFDWLPAVYHIFPSFGSCLAGISMSAAAVFVSLFIIGIKTNIFIELVCLILYILCSCGFCLVCGELLGNSARLGALTPFIMMIMLAVCPVFLDMGFEAKLLLPPTYYLYAPYNHAYLGYMAIYAAVCFGIAYILNWIKSKFPPRSYN